MQPKPQKGGHLRKRGNIRITGKETAKEEDKDGFQGSINIYDIYYRNYALFELFITHSYCIDPVNSELEIGLVSDTNGAIDSKEENRGKSRRKRRPKLSD